MRSPNHWTVARVVGSISIEIFPSHGLRAATDRCERLAHPTGAPAAADVQMLMQIALVSR